MRFNNNYKIGDVFSIVLPGVINKTTIKAFKYNIGSELSQVHIDIVTSNGYHFISLRTIENDSYYLITYPDGVEFIRIGQPPTMIFMYYQDDIINVLNYKQHKYDGTIVSEGTLTYIGNNIYAILVTNLERSFFAIEDTIVTLTLPEKYYSIASFTKGKILLQRGGWQLITIVESGKVKDIFLDRLARQENLPITELIEVVAAYPGHLNRFLTYSPGFTLPTSEHNFDLLINDNGYEEITSFWVKCKNWPHTTEDIVYSWSNTGSEVV